MWKKKPGKRGKGTRIRHVMRVGERNGGKKGVSEEKSDRREDRKAAAALRIVSL